MIFIYGKLTSTDNSLLIGNAVLIFSNVIHQRPARETLEKRPGVEQTLRQTLKLVEEPWLSGAARKNLGIFITKLVKSDAKFLDEFRRQHGTEILHSAMKNVEL